MDLALLEGLVGHSRSAKCRLVSSPSSSSSSAVLTNGSGGLEEKKGSAAAVAAGGDPLRFVRDDFRKLDDYTPVQPLEVVALQLGTV